MKKTEPKNVTLTIDGRAITVPFGTTILDAARRLEIDIPTLCEHPWIHRLASCRLCLVKIAGQSQPVASCTTAANDGLAVTTDDEDLLRLRRAQMQYILLNHPLDCPICDKAGECKLQDLTYRLGVTEVPFRADIGEQGIDTLSPLIERNDRRCIRCGRCVAVCHEVQAVGAYKFDGHGYRTKINTQNGGPLDCEFCGQCVAICPVGALLLKPFKHQARVWDLKSTETVCGYCGAGCQIELQTRRNRVYRVTSDLATTTNRGRLCVRGRFGWDFLHDERRVRTPLLRRDGELQPVSWDEALDALAAGVRHALDTGGPEAIGVLTGARLPIEDAFLLARVFGGSRLAVPGQDAYGAALKIARDRLGHPGSTADFATLRQADAILLLGSDLAAEMPVPHLDALAAVRENDARLIHAHPLPTKLEPYATARLPYRPGSQTALLLLLLRALVDRKGQNVDFIIRRTDGFAAFKAGLDRLNPAELLAQTGLELDAVEKAAAELAAAKRPVIVLGSAALTDTSAEAVTNLAIDLLLALGKVENGLLLSAESCNLYGAMLAGLAPGKGYAGVVEAGRSGRLGALLAFGADPLIDAPLAESLRQALEVTGFVVVGDSFLTETAKRAHLFLPTTTFAERAGTYLSGEGRLLQLNPALRAPEGVQSEWRILLALAERLGRPAPWKKFEAIRAEAMRAVPALGDAEAPAKNRQGVLLPRLVLAPETKIAFGKLPDPIAPPAGDHFLIAGPVFQHNGTLSRWSRAIAEICPAPWIELNPEDAARLGVGAGDTVRVANDGVEFSVAVRINARLRRGVVFAPRHFAEFPVGRLLNDPGGAVVTIKRSGA
ncbi:MAG: molybdopterin-dependent oxidoreductase [Myxococcales bacterium]|nr:molybdopterin-dependent oxidoreductase [Myxococcales bacterium]